MNFSNIAIVSSGSVGDLSNSAHVAESGVPRSNKLWNESWAGWVDARPGELAGLIGSVTGRGTSGDPDLWGESEVIPGGLIGSDIGLGTCGEVGLWDESAVIPRLLLGSVTVTGIGTSDVVGRWGEPGPTATGLPGWVAVIVTGGTLTGEISGNWSWV